MTNFKKISSYLAVATTLSFSGCGSSSSDEPTNNAELAEANIDTASKFLGTKYKLNGTPKSSTIQTRSETYIYNPYGTEQTNTISNGSNGGTKTYTFTPNIQNKNFTQQYKYLSYENEAYDSTCEKYATYKYNGTIDCSGNYSTVTNNKYYLKDKICTYSTPYTSGITNYDKDGIRKYNYIDSTRERNLKYTYNGDKRSKENWKYYYKKDANTKTYKIYNISGKLYFDNLSKYVEIDTSYNSSANVRTFDLCNNSVYSGGLQIITKNNIKMRFTTTQTNIVIVEKSSDGVTWENIGIFSLI